MPKSKKIGSFLKRIFRSSKSNLSKINIRDSRQNIENLKEDNYMQHETAKLRGQLALNRTYHGQTKHSEIKRLNFYEHFQSPIRFQDYDDND